MSANRENKFSGLQPGNVQEIFKKVDAKENSNCRNIAQISRTSKVILKVMPKRHHLPWSKQCWMVKLDSEKEEGLEI